MLNLAANFFAESTDDAEAQAASLFRTDFVLTIARQKSWLMLPQPKIPQLIIVISKKTRKKRSKMYECM